MKIKGIARAAFKRRIVEAAGGCAIQYDGWPCGSCFSAAGIGDLEGADWRAVLAFRGDYDKAIDGDVIVLCTDIERHADGSFKAHVMSRIPLAEIEARIRALKQRLGR